MLFREFLKTLEEKLIIYDKGQNYGQVVFLAGGAGSGKGFSVKKFMQGEKFKVIDVDQFKESFLKLAKEKQKYPEISDLKLKNPGDVFKLHTFVKNLGIKDKVIELILSGKNKETLPNILFDVTLKDLDEVDQIIPKLIAAGYSENSIHLTWILASFHESSVANKMRSRVVPDDILLKTHVGAAKTIWEILKNAKLPEGMNGDFRIVINNRDNTKVSAQKNTKGERIVTDFDYVTLKKSGKAMLPFEKSKELVLDFIKQNIPKTKETADIFKS